jgi:hypothetical protein
MKAPSRSSAEQKIPVKNNSEKDWTIILKLDQDAGLEGSRFEISHTSL